MKKSLLAVAVALLSLVRAEAQSNVYSGNIVGYVNKGFAPGDTLFTPPLWAANNYSGPQYLSQIFGVVPDGTTVSPWNPLTLSYQPGSTYDIDLGAWSINYDLHVGIGARLTTSTLFTNTFVGEVDQRGILPTLPNPTVVTVPHPAMGDGIYLLGSIMPIAATTFDQIIGRAPVDGEQVLKLDNTYTYDSLLGWRDQSNLPVVPTLEIAEAAFFNLGPVPEPSALALAGLGFGALLASRRRS
jgi:hypothetical protein